MIIYPDCPSCGLKISVSTVELYRLKGATAPVSYHCRCGVNLRLIFYRDQAGGREFEEVRITPVSAWVAESIGTLWSGEKQVAIQAHKAADGSEKTRVIIIEPDEKP